MSSALAEELEILVGDWNSMMYPDPHSNTIPHDIFTRSHADQAQVLSSKIVAKTREYRVRNIKSCMSTIRVMSNVVTLTCPVDMSMSYKTFRDDLHVNSIKL